MLGPGSSEKAQSRTDVADRDAGIHRTTWIGDRAEEIIRSSENTHKIGGAESTSIGKIAADLPHNGRDQSPTIGPCPTKGMIIATVQGRIV